MNTEQLTEIDIDQLRQDYGDYYISNTANMSNLHAQPFESFETADAFTIVPTNDTKIREANVEFKEIMQQYQDAYTPKGGVAFKPVAFDLYQMKIDLLFNPTRLQRSWIGFLTNNNLDRATYPFVKWLIEVYVMNKSKEDMEMFGIYSGIFEEPVEGVAGDASKIMNGVRKVVTDLGITPFVTGNSDEDPIEFVNQVEAFVKAMPEKYRRLQMPINMSRTNEEKFVEGMQDKYNMQYAQVAQLRNVRNYSNISVVGRPSMQGEEGIWASPKNNSIMGVKGFENRNAFRIESEKRNVAIFSDWWAGIYFIQPELVFVNDKVAY